MIRLRYKSKSYFLYRIEKETYLIERIKDDDFGHSY